MSGGSSLNPVKSPADRGDAKNHVAPSIDQLGFLDLLYAVVVADLGTRVSRASLACVSFTDWSALAVILAVIVLSWIGLHKNRAVMERTNLRKPVNAIDFCSSRFFQFVISVIIVLLYFAMGLQLHFPESTEPGSPVSAPWLTGLVAGIFFAYLLWDIFDVWQADWTIRTEQNKVDEQTRNPAAGKVDTSGLNDAKDWKQRARAGARVTAIFFLVVGLIYLYAVFMEPSEDLGMPLLNTFLIVILWVFRVEQDRHGNTTDPGNTTGEAVNRGNRARDLGFILGLTLLVSAMGGFVGGVMAEMAYYG